MLIDRMFHICNCKKSKNAAWVQAAICLQIVQIYV